MLRLSDRITGGIIGALALALVLVLAKGVGAGPLDPSGPPSSTLPQVEPRNPIPPVGWDGTFPIVINQPGSYFVTRNLSVSSATTALNVLADDVTVDLNGFVLDGADAGVFAIAGASNAGLTVKNGHIQDWNGYAIFGGVQGHYYDVTLRENGFGVRLDTGSVLEDCVASGSGTGVSSPSSAMGVTIRDCEFSGFGTIAIDVSDGTRSFIIDNQILAAHGGAGIKVGNQSTVRGNTIVGATATYTSIDLGASVDSVVVQNRLECGKGVGTSSDDVFIFDLNSDQTNICKP